MGVASLFLAGCATIIKGSSEVVNFTSSPAKAEVYVDGIFKGNTPMQLKLESKKTFTIEFHLSEYESQTAILTNSVQAGYVVLDVIFGLVSVIVDVATGLWYKLDRDLVHLEMVEK
jgi:hypothetical protein